MKKLLVGALCGLVSLPTFAADEWYLGGGNKDEVMLIDASTIETDGKIKGTWVSMVLAKPLHGFDYCLSWWDINCKAKKTKMTELAFYDIAGQKYKKMPDSDWERAAPGTLPAHVLETVCKGPTVSMGTFENASELAEEVRSRLRESGFWK